MIRSLHRFWSALCSFSRLYSPELQSGTEQNVLLMQKKTADEGTMKSWFPDMFTVFLECYNRTCCFQENGNGLIFNNYEHPNIACAVQFKK